MDNQPKENLIKEILFSILQVIRSSSASKQLRLRQKL